VTRVYREVHTGAELFERAELTQLREAMRQREFDILLVHALDRLSRKQTHQGLILSEAEYAGVQWVSVMEDVDDSPQGQILRAVIGGMAELERLKLAERTVRVRLNGAGWIQFTDDIGVCPLVGGARARDSRRPGGSCKPDAGVTFRA